MLTTSCDKFLNDNEIKVYLGASDYELKYYNEREIEKHKYAFHTDNSIWKRLVSESENKVSEPHAHDRIWVLNMVFLQMAIIKNAIFVLVTPTNEYYRYDKKEAIEFKMPDNPSKTYIPYYGRELEHINKAGYQWNEYFKNNVETRK